MKGFYNPTWFSICVSILLYFTISGASIGLADIKIHDDVWLKNELGETISPTRNRTDAYSPRKTCGGCHGYTTITSGYHFQQGFDEMSDRYSRKKPWVLSPGMYGKWQPAAAAALLARKTNRNTREMDLSTYDWIGGYGKLNIKSKIKSPACGWCHPGGGPLEYGRGADGRRDFSMNHVQAENKNTSPLDGDYTSRFTSDRRSHFKESGVLEADCLICHLPGYRMDDRNQQINVRNYRWAPAAGAGIGKVNGAIFTYSKPDAGPDHPQFMEGLWNFSRKPTATYYWQNKRFFTGEGRLKGNIISKSVGSRNCQQCHLEGDAKNTGSIHDARFDAHAAAKLQCTDCHGLIGRNKGERLKHQIAKGWSLHNTVRDDLDGASMKTCVTCHLEGGYVPTRKGIPEAAKNPSESHAEKLPKATFHTYIIHCTGCHATAQPGRGMYLLDMSAGQETGYTADTLETVLWLDDYAGLSAKPWKPWFIRAKTGKERTERYVPYVPKVFQWFGEKMANGEIRPISLREVRQSFNKVKGITTLTVRRTDGKMVQQSSVVSEDDIRRMILALTNRGFHHVVFVSDRVYEVNKGKVVSHERPVMAHEKPYPVDHNIVPVAKKATYGSGGNPDGCMNCHADDSAFFTKMKIKNMRGFLKDDYPALKKPHTESQMEEWGITVVPSFE
jgi:hypothetical protein